MQTEDSPRQVRRRKRRAELDTVDPNGKVMSTRQQRRRQRRSEGTSPRKSTQITKRELRRKANASILRRLRLQAGGCCCVCGSTERLHFHHVDPEKKFATISDLIHILIAANNPPAKTFWSDIIDKEVKRCILLCNSCHSRHHQSGKRNS